MGQKTRFYIPDDLQPVMEKYVAKYGSVREAILNAMGCVDTIYRLERPKLESIFTRQELNLMLNNALSTAYSPPDIPNAVLWSTEDEVDQIFENFGVDRALILDKLRNLTISQQFALVDWLVELRSRADA